MNTGAGVSTHHIQSSPAQIPETMHSLFAHSRSTIKMYMLKTTTAESNLKSFLRDQHQMLYIKHQTSYLECMPVEMCNFTSVWSQV